MTNANITEAMKAEALAAFDADYATIKTADGNYKIDSWAFMRAMAEHVYTIRALLQPTPSSIDSLKKPPEFLDRSLYVDEDVAYCRGWNDCIDYLHRRNLLATAQKPGHKDTIDKAIIEVLRDDIREFKNERKELLRVIADLDKHITTEQRQFSELYKGHSDVITQARKECE